MWDWTQSDPSLKPSVKRAVGLSKKMERVSINAVGDELVVTETRNTLTNHDQSIAVDAVEVWRFVDGRIVEVWDILPGRTEGVSK